LLNNVSNLLIEKTSAKGLELVFDVAQDVPANLVGDSLRLGQILINYANNAVKFTEKGEVDIVVRLRKQSPDGVMLYFAVRDTGIGLTEEQMARLFQSFQQADASTTRKYGGTGLGLAISKELASLMGGEVGVDSEYGIGSTFWFTAKLGLGSADKRSYLPEPDLRGKRVLVVDDNDSARIVLAELLSSMTFDVNSVTSGEAAIEAIRQAEQSNHGYEVVLLDWQMPGMDGIETARRINAMRLGQAPRLAMITAYDRNEVLKLAQAVGVDDVLIKPVTASTIFDALVRLFDDQREGESAHMEAIDSDNFAALARIQGAEILLAEDNPLNQQVATELLIDAGFKVEVAGNGRIAVEMAQARHYDIILMDMQMPEMDGIEATRLLRALPTWATLPIVAMTANAMQADRERCLEAGMNDFVSKPIELDELWRALLRWIKPRHFAPVLFKTKPVPEVAAVADLPAEIEGLDRVAGLRRVLGKPARYLSMLRGFVSSQIDVAQQIHRALEQNDTSTAERLAHTLKGLAGNIGADALQQDSEKLEQAIHHGQPAVELLQTVKTALARQIAAIVAAVPPEIQDVVTTVDRAQVEAICQELADLLADDNAKAEKLLNQHSALLTAALPEKFRPLAEAVRQFDYEKALVVLMEALPTLTSKP